MGSNTDNYNAFENFEPRRNAPIAAQQQPSAAPVELSVIDTMDAESLRILIRKVAGAIWGVKAMTGAELIKNAVASSNELYEALMLKGITLALNASEWREFNALATFWAERTKGKPLQSQEIVNNVMINDSCYLGLTKDQQEDMLLEAAQRIRKRKGQITVIDQ